jgi:hypothetical protein
VNRLAPVRDGDAAGGRGGDDPERYRLPRHAHVVVYDERERELITVYDCGAAQKPPSAQLLGYLVRVDADHEVRRSPTGYAVRLREPSVLERQGEDHWVIRG